jgi:hypothetical protein
MIIDPLCSVGDYLAHASERCKLHDVFTGLVELVSKSQNGMNRPGEFGVSGHAGAIHRALAVGQTKVGE